MGLLWQLRIVLASGAAVVAPSYAAMTSLTPTKDAMILATSAGVDTGTASGNGVELFAGADGNAGRKRSLLAFDIASAVPTGATITAATLTLTLAQVAGAGQGGGGATISSRTFSLHDNLQHWTEGSSGTSVSTSFSGAGNGYARRSGDTTWDYASYNASTWNLGGVDQHGGNFAAAASATATFTSFDANSSTYSFSGPGLTADVQTWLNSPSTNEGWLLKADTGITSTGSTVDLETTPQSFLGFYSREGAGTVTGSLASYAPTLTITYTPEPVSLSMLGMSGLLLLRRRTR